MTTLYLKNPEVVFYLSTDKHQVHQTTGMRCPLQKKLHDPAGSRQTTHGPYDVCSDAQNHRRPSSLSSPPSQP